jgi:transglutaminase-like putative cysteine protease
MTDALAALGMLSILSSGGLERWVVVALGLGLLAAIAIPERYQGHPLRRRGSVVGSVLLLGTQVARLVLGHDILQVAIEFAGGLQILRIATRRGAAHDQQIVLLALLHLIAGTVLGGGMAYGFCFMGFLIVAPGALVLSHLRREVEGNYRQGARDRSGLPVDVPRILRSRRVVSRRFLAATCSLSIPIFLFTALLFVFFPRVGLSLLLLNQNRGERMIGFSDQVDLGKVGRLRADSTIAMRVFLPDLPPEPPPRIPLYLRGVAFDSYDGASWRRDKTQVDARNVGERVWIGSPSIPLGGELMTIDLEPIKPPVLFLPAGAGAFDVLAGPERIPGTRPRITRGREGDFEYVRQDERGLRYRVLTTAGHAAAAPLADAGRYLALPTGLGDRVAQLARDWVGPERDPRAIARTLEQRLRAAYAYDLDSPSGAAANPLEHFLFESKRGHCEFYSTSMAVMLRTQGIPSRNVTGFIGGTFNRFGRFYAVRQGEAHSWVEAYLPGEGWTRFDPTPSAASAPTAEIQGAMAFIRDLVEAAGERWDRHVIGYDLGQQIELFSEVRRKLRGTAPTSGWIKVYGREVGIALVALGAGAFAFYWWRKRGARGPRAAPPTARDLRVARIVKLYQQLDEALRVHGITRGVSTPPLTHARALRGLGHPCGDEAYALTEWYVAVRFGDAPLDESGYAEFASRVAALRRMRVERAA